MKTSPSSAFLPPLLQRKPLVEECNAEYFCTRFANYKILVMPGLHGSDQDHWQSAWERWYPEFQRVEQADWESPDLDLWARCLIERATGGFRPVIVVAHSYGCLATVRALILQPGLIAGALLVAPAEPDRFNAKSRLPHSTLGIPTTIVASTNDPYLSVESAEQWADRWGSQIVTLKDAGHINVQSDHRTWPWGLELLESIARRATNVNGGKSKISKLPGQPLLLD